MIIVVSGAANVGKSTFIRFGLDNLIAKHDSNRSGNSYFQITKYLN
jgi:GTP-binding protein EngB required for normal cell division